MIGTTFTSRQGIKTVIHSSADKYLIVKEDFAIKEIWAKTHAEAVEIAKADAPCRLYVVTREEEIT